MTWIVEEPLQVLLLGGLFIAICGGIFIQTGRYAALYCCFGAMALTGGLLLLEHLVVTDQEQVESIIHLAAERVEASDVSGVQQLVHSQATSIKNRIPQITAYNITDINIKKITFESKPRHQPPQIIARFNMSAKFDGVHGAAYVELTFQREDEAWKIREQYAGDAWEGIQNRAD